MTTDIQTAALLANFAELAYRPNGTPPAGWALIPNIGTAAAGSFAAYAYRNTTTGQIVISYTGTNGAGDLTGADIPILLGGAGNQLTPAADFAARIQKAFPDENILVTGHSLGGALAQVVSSMFGFDGAAMDPLAAASILATPEYQALALALTGDTVNHMPSTFTNYGVTQSIVSGGTGTQLGAMQNVPSLGLSLLDWAGTALATLLNPVAGLFTLVGLDQAGNKHASAQIAQTLDLMANAVHVDNTSGSGLFAGAVTMRARTEQVFNSATGQMETRIFSNEIEFVNAGGQVLSTGVFSGALDNRKLEVYAPGATVPGVTCLDTSRAGDANLMNKGDLICYAPDNSVTIIDANNGITVGEIASPSNTFTPTADYLASLAEFIRTEMGGNDAAIVNATEIRTLTGAQGGNEVSGIGGALELSNSNLANWYTYNEALYAYNVAHGITAPGGGAPYNPAPYHGIADLIAGGQTPDIGLGILPGFTTSPTATFLTFGSGGSSANVCLAPYATAPAWDANAPQAIAPPAANSYGYYGPNFSSFPFDPYLYYNNWAGDIPVYAPVVLDLDGDGIELIGKADSRAYYDVKGDGYKHNIGWVGADDGFLAIDTDGDGVISAANELSFALWTTDPNDTDVQALKSVFDTNNNGMIDAGDAQFGQLRIWQDKNGDGVTDQGELKTLAQAGIASLSLDVAQTHYASGGNLLSGFTTYQKADGSSGWAADVGLGYEVTGWQVANDAVFEVRRIA